MKSRVKMQAARLSLSERMARITKRHTKPELLVRRLLHANGFRFRLHRNTLPGSPDIVFPGRKKVIFVHGCFWHRHNCKAGRKLPKANLEYWVPKLARNQERDSKHIQALCTLGWSCLVLWECELSDKSELTDQLLRFLR
jgi:DNA mismatch endonuclease (patch repair protein)